MTVKRFHVFYSGNLPGILGYERRRFFQRMQKEHERFWNNERLARATAIGMTPEEVCTLASIVEEETNNNEENRW